MRNIFILFFIIASFTGCVSVDRYNRHLNDLHSEKQLKSDIDYIYKKLQKLHPSLYWYISKKELDMKFDSLKSTIHSPMTSNEFYLKLSPVIASVKEGHLRVFQLNKRLKFREKMERINSGTSPFAKMEFECFNNKLYVVKNNSDDKSMVAGLEVVKVNDAYPQELFSKFRNTFSSDGYNKTFIERRLSKGFPNYFYYQHGITDSVSCLVKYHDTLKMVYLKRKPADRSGIKEKPQKPSLAELEKAQKEKNKQRELGYDGLSKTYSKSLRYLAPDSSIALMKITDFYKGRYKNFFSHSFRQMDSLKTKHLILDLRDNPGGRLREVYNLYSYLVDSDYHFIDKSEVTSKFSLLHTVNFRGLPPVSKAFFIAFSPLRLIVAGIVFVKVKKKDHKFYYTWKESKPGHSNPLHFKGKLYVIVNGGSFSATCLLSSNLKGSKRAVFVGEETGGAFNGTVAGLMPTITLPASKLPVVFGLALIQPHYKTETEGRGIFPDVMIQPTIEDRLKENDPELNWILDDVKGKHNEHP